MINYQWLSMSEVYYANRRYEDTDERQVFELTGLKNEELACQLLLWSNETTHYTFSPDVISWRGIHLPSYRIHALNWHHESGTVMYQKPNLAFVDYVNDDDGKMVSDPILNSQGMERDGGCAQGIWVSCKFDPKNLPGIYKSTVSIYMNQGYEGEVLVAKLTLQVKLLDGQIQNLKESDFFLDLWQHPSNWARTYQVPMWSDQHFQVIKNYLQEMARIGQKVVDIICSDYSWAGQRCYDIDKNPSNLFEHNMAKIRKKENGDFSYDFNIIKRYIEISKEVGISEEIDLFGLLGNWDRVAFGNPLKDYSDPIRVRYFDEATTTYKFMDQLDEVKAYIGALFEFLVQIGVWDRVRVICDEPDHPESFKKAVDILKNLATEPLKIKSAIHVPRIVPSSASLMDDISLGINVLANKKADVSDISDEIHKKKGKLTWYICCFPKRPNNFIGSPRIENRLVGWMTHYFNLDGFLRWDFAIWPSDPYKDASYKYPKWSAGDMFFVYPGKDLYPVRSQRLENLLVGIQDYVMIKEVLNHCDGEKKASFTSRISGLLGDKEKMEEQGLNIEMGYSLDTKSYEILHDELAHEFARIKK